MNSKKRIKDLYTNIKLAGSFSSAVSLIKEQGLDLKPEEVKKILSELDVFTLHPHLRKRFRRRQVEQMNLIIMTSVVSGLGKLA